MNAQKLQRDPETKRHYVRIQAGKVRRRHWFSQNKKKAQRELKKLLKNIAKGVEVIAPTRPLASVNPANGSQVDMRLEVLAHRHLEWVEHNRSAATYKLRRQVIRTFINFMGPCMVSEVTKLKLSEFYDYARAEHGRGPNPGNWLLRNVRSMFRWAEDWEICPMPVRKFPPMTSTPPPTKRFTDDEVKKLLERLPPGNFRDLIIFGLITGLRPQELRDLRREHIFTDGNQRQFIRLEVHKTAKMQRDPRPRTVPLNIDAEEIVNRQLAKHDSQFVFLTEYGTPYSADVFRRKLERWCARAGISKRTPYALRHTFASVEAESGVDALTLAQLMGHTDISTTARYVSTTQEHHRLLSQKAAAHINRLLEASAKDNPDAPNGEHEPANERGSERRSA